MQDDEHLKSVIRQAGRLALQSFRKVTPSLKDNQTYVTQADLAVQQYLFQALEAQYPADGIIAEEEALRKQPASGDRYWIVDPIDGTSSFVSGLPVWGISVGLLEGDDVKVGFFYMPVLDELYHSTKQGHVFRNDDPTSLRPPADLQRETILLTTTNFHKTRRLSAHYPGHVKCFGSAAAHLCYAATGTVDAVFLEGVHVWDIAAGLAMLQHNGGTLRYVGGEAVVLSTWLSGEAIRRPMLGGHPEVVARLEPLLVIDDPIG